MFNKTAKILLDIKSINLIVGYIADLLLDLNSKKQAIEEKKDNSEEASK